MTKPIQRYLGARCNFDGLGGNLCWADHVQRHQKLCETLSEKIAEDIASR